MRLDYVKSAGDAASVGVTIGALLQALPHIAALLTVIWLGYRVYESRLAAKNKKLEAREIELRIARLEAGHVDP